MIITVMIDGESRDFHVRCRDEVLTVYYEIAKLLSNFTLKLLLEDLNDTEYITYNKSVINGNLYIEFGYGEEDDVAFPALWNFISGGLEQTHEEIRTFLRLQHQSVCDFKDRLCERVINMFHSESFEAVCHVLRSVRPHGEDGLFHDALMSYSLKMRNDPELYELHHLCWQNHNNLSDIVEQEKSFLRDRSIKQQKFLNDAIGALNDVTI